MGQRAHGGPRRRAKGATLGVKRLVFAHIGRPSIRARDTGRACPMASGHRRARLSAQIGPHRHRLPSAAARRPRGPSRAPLRLQFALRRLPHHDLLGTGAVSASGPCRSRSSLGLEHHVCAPARVPARFPRWRGRHRAFLRLESGDRTGSPAPGWMLIGLGLEPVLLTRSVSRRRSSVGNADESARSLPRCRIRPACTRRDSESTTSGPSRRTRSMKPPVETSTRCSRQCRSAALTGAFRHDGERAAAELEDVG